MPSVDFTPASFLNPLLFDSARASTKRKNEKTKKTGASPFLQTLEKAKTNSGAESAAQIDEELTREQKLDLLLDDIHSAGDDLLKRPFPNEVKQYREAIKKLINYVVENSYDVVEDAGIPNREKPQYKDSKDSNVRITRTKYATVKIINQKLDKQAADILMGQQSQIKLLAGIEEINGLLVDLLR